MFVLLTYAAHMCWTWWGMHVAMIALTKVYLRQSLCGQGWGPHSAQSLFTTFNVVYVVCNLHFDIFFTLGTVYVTRDGGPIVLKLCLHFVGLFMYFAMFTLTMIYFRYSSFDQIWGHMVHKLCLQHLG